MVNNRLEITQVRGSTTPFIEIPSGQPTHNLMKMVRKELLPVVRMSLQLAMKQNEPVRKENLNFEFGNEYSKFNLEVIPVNPQSPRVRIDSI